MVVDEELLPAMYISHQAGIDETMEIEELTSGHEEADERIVPHAHYAVSNGCQRLIVVSNDTDVVARLLRYVHPLRCKGLQECWVEYSTG